MQWLPVVAVAVGHYHHRLHRILFFALGVVVSCVPQESLSAGLLAASAQVTGLQLDRVSDACVSDTYHSINFRARSNADKEALRIELVGLRM